MELTKEVLIDAAEDITKVCNLEPPFGTDSKGFSSEKEFMENLVDEVVQFLEFKDPETSLYDFQAGDIALLKESTKKVIIDLSPETAKRLKEVFEANKEKTPPPAPKKRKTASSLVVSFLCSNFNATKEDIKEHLRINEFKLSDAYIDGWISEFNMIISELKEQGILK